MIDIQTAKFMLRVLEERADIKIRGTTPSFFIQEDIVILKIFGSY